MLTDKEFSLQSTSIAQNPESNTPSFNLSKVKSEKFLYDNSLTSSQTTPLQLLKHSLKLLQLHSSQCQFILNQVQQFQQQNYKHKLSRNKQSLKRTPSIESKKKPPLPQKPQQSRQKVNSNTKKFNSQHLSSQSTIPTFLNPLQLPSQSSIIKATEQNTKILNFFPQNTVKGFALIFKASEHKFSVKDFFKLCGKSQNLMIICQTNKQKVIGAFSPISHEFSGKNGFEDKWGQKVRDPCKQSFIFSLSNNHKFRMKSQQHAIYRWRDKKYIVFGNWELTICDEANLSRNCRTDNINFNYMNEKYKNSKQSWLKLNGNEDPWFTTVQWEAWKVDFQSAEL